MVTRLAEQLDQVTVEVALDADDPLVRLRGLKAADKAVERWLGQAVGEARKAGVSWSAIGEALGVSRQGAWKLYNAELLDAMRASQERSGLTDDEAMDLAVSELHAIRKVPMTWRPPATDEILAMVGGCGHRVFLAAMSA